MKPVQAFMTTDGLIFTSEDEAFQHEADLAILPTIDAFLNSTANTYHGVPQKSIARSAIARWEKWKNDNV
jgi:hypothetical protein